MKLRRVLLFLAAALLVLAGAVGWFYYGRVFGPGPSFAGGPRIVLVPTGAGFEQLADSLRAQGLIPDERLFRAVAARKRLDRRVRPGRYRIARGTSLNTLVNKLRSGEQDPVRVTFTNIRTLAQLAGHVARYIEPDSAALLHEMQRQAQAGLLGVGPETMISLFIPDTYELWWTTTPAAFVDRMAREHRRFWTAGRLEKARAIGLDPVRVATLASVVQAETARADEAPIIAGVYLNRLRIGMPLQADPTLKFALGMDSISRVLDADKLVDSPYNTYTHAGLPPGPINMPERRYIDAVLNAQAHEYLYFCARETLDGYSNFARTYEQHLVNARRYQRALNARGIYR